MNNFIVISGWLAVPKAEYIQLMATNMCEEDFFYCELKYLADARNDFEGNDYEFKSEMLKKKKYRHSMIDFINVHYAIRQFYAVRFK